MSALSGFILVLLGFGFLIFIHELGHFLAAKWAGIRADGFAIGMGPCVVSYRRGIGFCTGSADAKVVRLHGKRPIEMSDSEREGHGIGETEYSLRALPLGGYVRMLGQEDGNPDATSTDARSFGMASIPRRAVVILAGITANLLLAIVLFLVAFLVGVRFPAPTIGFVVPDSPAARATPSIAEEATGLLPGDRVLTIDGDETRTFVDLRVAAAMSRPEVPLAIQVEREGRVLEYSVLPVRDAGSGLLSIGVDPARSSAITGVRDSREQVLRAIGRLGLTDPDGVVGPGARIVSIDGRAVGTFAEVERATRDSTDGRLTVEWKSADGQRTATLEMEAQRDAELLLHADGGAVDRGIIGLTPLPRVLEFAEGSANTESLRHGDVFLRVGPIEGPSASQLIAHFRANPNTRFEARVLRGGEEVDCSVKTDRSGRAGIFLDSAWELPLLAKSVDEVAGPDGPRATPAKMLAAVPLGSVLSMNGEPVADLAALRAKLQALSTRGTDATEVRIGLRDPAPNAAPHEVEVTLTREDLESLRALGYSFPLAESFFDPEFVILEAGGNPLTAVRMGFHQTIVMVEQVFLTIDRVVRGSVGADQLQGPVGILHTGTKVADEGFMYIVFFLALISVNLAVVNLLPIPIADGGLFVFLMYEWITGRPPSIAFQNAAAMAGIALVAGLFLLTFYNDLGRIFG